MDLNRECKGLGSEAQFRAQQLTGPTPKGPDLHAARAGPAEQLKGWGGAVYLTPAREGTTSFGNGRDWCETWDSIQVHLESSRARPVEVDKPGR